MNALARVLGGCGVILLLVLVLSYPVWIVFDLLTRMED